MALFGEPVTLLGVAGGLLVAAGVGAVSLDKAAHGGGRQAGTACSGAPALKAKSSFRLAIDDDEEVALGGSGSSSGAAAGDVQLRALDAEPHHRGPG